jgi:arginine repressor
MTGTKKSGRKPKFGRKKSDPQRQPLTAKRIDLFLGSRRAAERKVRFLLEILRKDKSKWIPFTDIKETLVNEFKTRDVRITKSEVERLIEDMKFEHLVRKKRVQGRVSYRYCNCAETETRTNEGWKEAYRKLFEKYQDQKRELFTARSILSAHGLTSRVLACQNKDAPETTTLQAAWSCCDDADELYEKLAEPIKEGIDAVKKAEFEKSGREIGNWEAICIRGGISRDAPPPKIFDAIHELEQINELLIDPDQLDIQTMQDLYSSLHLHKFEREKEIVLNSIY